MDLLSILLLTVAVLGVLLVVLAIIAVVVLLPPVRRRLAERTHDDAQEANASANAHNEKG